MDYLKEAANRRETAIITRLEANPVFDGLPERVRTIIATKIVPVLAEFNHRNDKSKKDNFAGAAACFLKDTISQQGLAVTNTQAASILQTICNDPGAQQVANNINANNPQGISLRNTPKVKALYEAFEHRAEKITAIRGRE